jgi:tetratricopeptide (TPR) repeat protein
MNDDPRPTDRTVSIQNIPTDGAAPGGASDTVPEAKLEPPTVSFSGSGEPTITLEGGVRPATEPGEATREAPCERADESFLSVLAGRSGASARYKILEEIARGGMGAVLRGRDLDLGRELALKVLLESHRGRPELVRRFIEEAQIGGQLQHPGIVPVYDLGAFDDQRPFLAMKLVRGLTLAELLQDRAAPEDDRPRLLGIFEQVCQAVAYAHARGVIHRDLKPSNIMVGGFGEVQVMDWGLAKVLKHDGRGSTDYAPRGDDSASVHTTRSGSDVDLSIDGGVLGTPAYMAPEQARGEVDRVDRRADVFGLGSILCEILTGAPAFEGRTGVEKLALAARADIEDAVRRLDASGAEPELIALARSCLAADRDARPADAAAVSGAMTSYLNGIQTRLKAAEIERAEAQARASEERKRRRAERSLAAALLALIVVGGGVGAWGLRARRNDLARIDLAVQKARLLADRAHADPSGDPELWRAALLPAEGADELASKVIGGAWIRRETAHLRAEIASNTDAAARDWMFLRQLDEIRVSKEGYSREEVLARYADAFRKDGIDFDRMTRLEVAEAVRAKPPRVAQAIAATLEDSALELVADGQTQEGHARLDMANVADPHPWRVKVRNAILSHARSREQLIALAQEALADRARLGELPPQGLILLAHFLIHARDRPRAIALLRAAQRVHPGDVWINFELAHALELATPAEPAEVVRYYSIAAAMRPETGRRLALALNRIGRRDEAIAWFEDLTRLLPEEGRNFVELGHLLRERGDAAKADAAFDQGIARLEEQIKQPGVSGVAWNNLGSAIEAKGNVEGAIAAYRRAVSLSPNIAIPRDNLARLLLRRGETKEAVEQLHEACRLSPNWVAPRFMLANALSDMGISGEAEAHYRAVIALAPEMERPRYFLGNLLRNRGDYAEAIAQYRDALKREPEHAEALCNMGLALEQVGDFAEAVRALERGHAIGSRRKDWRYPSQAWVDEAKGLVEIETRLAAFLEGKYRPKDGAEGVALGHIAYLKHRYTASARLYAEAIASTPALAPPSRTQHRYDGACSAALAASGKGGDVQQPDTAARDRFRSQALAWLRADLDVWRSRVKDGSKSSKAKAAGVLRHWKVDTDLAGLRDPAAVDSLPEPDRMACRALWAEVDALLKSSR